MIDTNYIWWDFMNTASNTVESKDDMGGLEMREGKVKWCNYTITSIIKEKLHMEKIQLY